MIRAQGKGLLDAGGQPLVLRGINLQYGDAPSARAASFEPIAATGANVVRVQLRAGTTAEQLRAALDQVVANGLVAMLMYSDAGVSCQSDPAALDAAVAELWLGRWLPVLAEAKYQPHLMINIASKWGPPQVFNAASEQYAPYIAAYVAAIERLREAGFKVPLVIDAPGCGQDFYAFMNGRAQTLAAADVENNLVVSAHAFEGHWQNAMAQEIAISALQALPLPFVVGEFGSQRAATDAIDDDYLMALAGGDGALSFDLPWPGGNAQASFSTALTTTLDLTGARVAADVYVPAAYANAGYAVQVYVVDSQWRLANINYQSLAALTKGAWNRLNYTITDDSSFGYKSAGFNLTDITRVGFQLVATDGAAAVAEPIQFDNLSVSLPADGAVYRQNFGSNKGGWEKAHGDPAAVDAVGGALAVTPSWGSGTGRAVAVGRDGVIAGVDFSKELIFTARVYLPESFASEPGRNAQIFAQYDDWTFETIRYVDATGLQAGAWNVISGAMRLAGSTGGLTTFNRLGVQVGGVDSAPAGDILIDDVTIEEKPSFYHAKFNGNAGGFSLQPWGDPEGTVTHVDGALAVTPDWSASKFAARTSTMGGYHLPDNGSIKARVKFPEGYAGQQSLYFQLYLQMGSNWQYTPVGSVGTDRLVPGRWSEITMPISSSISNATPNSQLALQAIGFEIGSVSGAPAGAILIDDLRIVDNHAPAVRTAVEFDFNNGSEGFTFHYGSVPFDTEGSVAGRFGPGFREWPFGWMAWSWTGNGTGLEALNVSTAENNAALTPRGEDVVNGEHGLGNTARPAAFE